MRSTSFVKIQNRNWQKVRAGGAAILEFLSQTYFVRCIQLTFELISVVSIMIYADEDLTWKTSFKSTGGWLWLLSVSSVIYWTNSNWQEKPYAPERVFAVARKSLPALEKLCLGETAAYDNMLIFIRADTVIYNHSITLFTWKIFLFKNTTHLCVQFNDELFIVI